MVISSYMIGLSAHLLPTVTTRLGILLFFSIFGAWFPLPAFLGNTEALINGLEGWTRPEDHMAPPERVTFETKVLTDTEANWIIDTAKKNTSGFLNEYWI